MISRFLIERELRHMVAELLHISNEEVNLAESPVPGGHPSGLDSIASLLLRENIEREFRLYMSDEVWLNILSLEALITYIDNQHISNSFRPLRCDLPLQKSQVYSGNNWSLPEPGQL